MSAPPPLSYMSVDAPAGPAYKLHSIGGVMLATFLGSPVAGAVLMARNFRTLGEKAKARNTLVFAMLLMIPIGIVLAILPGGRTPGSIFTIAAVFAMRSIMQHWQGGTLLQHQVAGGKLVSKWIDAGLALLIAIVVMVALVGVAFAWDSATAGTTLKVSSSEEIVYSGDTTNAEAQTLGKALKTAGFFDGTGTATVFLRKRRGHVTVSFVLGRQYAKDPAMLDELAGMVDRIAAALGGKPVTLELLNEDAEVTQNREIK